MFMILLYYGIPKKKRWSSWNKQDKQKRDFLLEIATAFQIGIIEATSLVDTLDNESLDRIKDQLKELRLLNKEKVLK